MYSPTDFPAGLVVCDGLFGYVRRILEGLTFGWGLERTCLHLGNDGISYCGWWKTRCELVRTARAASRTHRRSASPAHHRLTPHHAAALFHPAAARVSITREQPGQAVCASRQADQYRPPKIVMVLPTRIWRVTPVRNSRRNRS